MKHDKLFTYATNTVHCKRKGNPSLWDVVGDIIDSVKMFHSYPYFSFIPGTRGDEEPIRYGDFVIDIDTKELACGSARLIIDWFRVIYGVDPKQWRIYLSGKKGIHLELPAEILGTENGHIWLPIAYKILARDLEAALSVDLDTSMYNKGTGKPYRRPNVMRETGTCKRQIDFDDLFEIEDEEEYREACKEPGDIWQPEDVSRNKALAEKISVHLKEAEKQQEAIKLAPKLSGDERDRLINERPACINVLARLTEWTNGKTFNDIAIQLTAYAITARISEDVFLAGCKYFIESYPSSSLDSPTKRYENCRARYRTMEANGNAHSCGGVLALGVPGFDCNTCNCKTAGPQVTVEVMEAEDLEQENISLQIPDEILNPGGLISLGMKALSAPGMVDIPQYNMAVILTTIANAVAGKIVCCGISPNLFNKKVGDTSTGKTSSDRAMVKAITAVGIPNFYGVTDFASGPALLRSLAENPIQMIVIDEGTSLFKRYAHGDSNSDGKREALLEIYSASGGHIKKAYADSKNSIEIIAPCLSLTGNATTTIFEAIQQEDFETGTMQRFDFWCYDGPVPERGYYSAKDNERLVQFAEGIAAIRAAKSDGGNLEGFGGVFPPKDIGVTDEAAKILDAWSKEITAKCNAVESGGERGLISRAYDLAVKYAMVHIGGTREPHEIFFPMDVQDIEYGKKVAWMLCDWKVNVLRDRVSSGEFDQMCKTFKAAIKAAIDNGKRPTLKTMVHRRRAMKNWRKRDTDEVIFILEKRGEIVKDNEKPTGYHLVK